MKICKVIMTGLLLAGMMLRAEWVGGVDDDYLNAANWAGGEIDDTFTSATVVGSDVTLVFTNDHTITGDLVTKYAANHSQNLIFEGSGGVRTITLTGDILHQPTLTYNTWFSTLRFGNDLTLNVPWGTHQFQTGTESALRNVAVGALTGSGAIDKHGAGILEIGDDTDAYTGTITVHEGALVAGVPNVFGGEKRVVVNTTSGGLSGVGVTGPFGFPEFDHVGEEPGMLLFCDNWWQPLGDVAKHWISEGWYVGAVPGPYRFLAPGERFPPVKDKIYRFAGGGSLCLSRWNILEEDHGALFGSPRVGGIGSVNIYEAQYYTGPTLVYGLGGAIVSVVEGNGASLETSEMRLRATAGNAAELCLQAYNAERVQRIPETSPIILESVGGRKGDEFLEATFRVRIIPRLDCLSVTNGIGPLVVASGRAGIIHGWGEAGSSYNFDWFLTTETPAIERRNRSAAYVALNNNWVESATTRNPPLGTWRETTSAGGVGPSGNRLLITGTPLELAGNTDNPAMVDKPIVPFLYWVNSVWYPGSLMTYEPATGLRPLRATTDIDGNPPEFVIFTADETISASNPFVITASDVDPAGYDNVRILASFYDPRFSYCLDGDVTVNALFAEGAAFVNIAADSTLRVKSGVVMGGSIGAHDAATSILDFGDAEGILYGGNIITVGIGASIAGNNGLTIVGNNNGSLNAISGRNTYRGPTTVVRDIVAFGRQIWCDAWWQAEPNVTLPDDGELLIHPEAIAIIGAWSGENSHNHCTREVIGGLRGNGTLQLNSLSNPSGYEWRNSALTIGEVADWEVWTNTLGKVLLNGGYLQPGMDGYNGTLAISTARQGGDPIPVELRNGALNIDITKAPVTGATEHGKLAITGDLTIGAGTNLVLNVAIEEGITLANGQTFPIVTADAIHLTGTRLFHAIVSDIDPRLRFVASLSTDEKSILLTVEPNTLKTIIIIR